MNVYDLTDLTGQRADEVRTVTVMTIDFRPKVLIVGVTALLPSVILASALWSLINAYAVLVPVVVVAIAVWLFTARTSDARRMPQYQAMLDARKAKSAVGRFVVGTREVDPMMSDNLLLVTASVPVGSKGVARTHSPAERERRIGALFSRMPTR